MNPQFMLWIEVLSVSTELTMDYLNDGFYSDMGVTWTDFVKESSLTLEDLKLGLQFSVAVDKPEHKRVKLELDMDYVGLLNNEVGKIYYKGLLKPRGESEELISEKFACSYE